MRSAGKPTAPAGAVLPLDWILAAYNLILAVMWLSVGSGSPRAIPLAALHALAVGIPWVLRRTGRRHLLGEIYPLVLLGPFWLEMGVLFATRGIPAHDARVLRLDQALFGFHPHQAWMTAMPSAWISEPMYLLYSSYYLLLAVPALALLFPRRIEVLRELALRVMSVYVACQLCNLVFPVLGPQIVGRPGESGWAPGLLAGLTRGVHHLGDSAGTAFPSSHCAGAVAVAWLAWRRFRRPLGWLMVLWAAGVTVSTVYTRNHYAADTLAGVLLGIVVQLLVSPLRPAAAASPASAPPPPPPGRSAPA